MEGADDEGGKDKERQQEEDGRCYQHQGPLFPSHVLGQGAPKRHIHEGFVFFVHIFNCLVEF